MTGPAPLFDLAVVNYVRRDDRVELTRLLQSAGFHALELDGSSAVDGRSFLAAASSQLLHGGQAASWAAFGDSLRSRVGQLAEPSSALVWDDASKMLDGGLSDLVTALDVCTDLARELYRRDQVFVVFLLGEGKNFPPLDGRFRATA